MIRFFCKLLCDYLKLLSVINPKVKREGCVYRDSENTRSFKTICLNIRRNNYGQAL